MGSHHGRLGWFRRGVRPPIQDLRSRGRGKILLVASLLAYQGVQNFAVYSAAKAYVLRWVKPCIENSSEMASRLPPFARPCRTPDSLPRHTRKLRQR